VHENEVLQRGEVQWDVVPPTRSEENDGLIPIRCSSAADQA